MREAGGERLGERLGERRGEARELSGGEETRVWDTPQRM
jgi:hypothetical protein